ncbi:MAG: glycosyltransferase family 39 protein [Planctomycetaceae bacterium]
MPAQLTGIGLDETIYLRSERSIRSEFSAGDRFLELNGPRALWQLKLARWMCVPFSLLGAWTCYRWSRDLFGEAAGFAALLLWCFSPAVLGHGTLITADVASASFFVATCYAFRNWLLRPSWRSCATLGVFLGTALLVKFTCLLLFAILGLLSVCSVLFPFAVPPGSGTGTSAGSEVDSHLANSPGRRLRTGQLALAFALAMFLVNLGFGFEGTGTRLRDYNFVSQALAGPHDTVPPDAPERRTSLWMYGNRFRDQWVGRLPVPIPVYYLRGIDIQKKDFEAPRPSYLFGKWKSGGWWYYYLAGALVKLPVGTLLLIFVGLLQAARGVSRCHPVDEFLLIVPMLAVLGVCSAQTNMSHHLRYCLPALPFLFISISRGVSVPGAFRNVAAAAVVGMLLSSLWVFPNSLSFFNLAAGGPENGKRYLLHSNLDWGQNFLFLKDWMAGHPEARPLILHDHAIYEPRHLGLDVLKPTRRPTPGWHAVTSDVLCGGANDSGWPVWLLDEEPVAVVGYSVHIFHVTQEQADAATREYFR